MFSPAVHNPLDSTYDEIAANFIAYVFNYDIFGGISLTFDDAITAYDYSVVYVFLVVY